MKKYLLILNFIIAVHIMNAQKSIDDLFNKYACKDGFVTFTMNGDLLKFCNLSDDDNDSFSGNITKIRILVQDNDNLKVENFYDLVIKDLNLNQYEEFMRVKESDQDVRILVRTEGSRFKEFLLIAGGDDNVLIQVKGDMTYEEAKKFTKEAKMEHGMNMVVNHK